MCVARKISLGRHLADGSSELDKGLALFLTEPPLLAGYVPGREVNGQQKSLEDILTSSVILSAMLLEDVILHESGQAKLCRTLLIILV